MHAAGLAHPASTHPAAAAARTGEWHAKVLGVGHRRVALKVRDLGEVRRLGQDVKVLRHWASIGCPALLSKCRGHADASRPAATAAGCKVLGHRWQAGGAAEVGRARATCSPWKAAQVISSSDRRLASVHLTKHVCCCSGTAGRISNPCASARLHLAHGARTPMPRQQPPMLQPPAALPLLISDRSPSPCPGK